MVNLNQESFKSWLKTRDLDEHVGKARNIYCCPITAWVRETTKYPRAYVGVDSIVLDSYSNDKYLSTSQDIPNWAATFIYYLDTSADVYESVTAGECLRVLAEMKKETARRAL